MANIYFRSFQYFLNFLNVSVVSTVISRFKIEWAELFASNRMGPKKFNPYIIIIFMYSDFTFLLLTSYDALSEANTPMKCYFVALTLRRIFHIHRRGNDSAVCHTSVDKQRTRDENPKVHGANRVRWTQLGARMAKPSQSIQINFHEARYINKSGEWIFHRRPRGDMFAVIRVVSTESGCCAVANSQTKSNFPDERLFRTVSDDIWTNIGRGDAAVLLMGVTGSE